MKQQAIDQIQQQIEQLQKQKVELQKQTNQFNAYIAYAHAHSDTKHKSDLVVEIVDKQKGLIKLPRYSEKKNENYNIQDGFYIAKFSAECMEKVTKKQQYENLYFQLDTYDGIAVYNSNGWTYKYIRGVGYMYNVGMGPSSKPEIEDFGYIKADSGQFMLRDLFIKQLASVTKYYDAVIKIRMCKYDNEGYEIRLPFELLSEVLESTESYEQQLSQQNMHTDKIAELCAEKFLNVLQILQSQSIKPKTLEVSTQTELNSNLVHGEKLPLEKSLFVSQVQDTFKQQPVETTIQQANDVALQMMKYGTTDLIGYQDTQN